MFGSNREGELQRTAELVVSINDEQGLYFAVAFLHDAQYDRDDICRILEIMRERRIGFIDNVKE